MIVTLYTRPGCHLCDEARDAIEGLRDESPAFELDEVDIESDERLLADMLERIPVIELDGELISELIFDVDRLRARMGTLSA